MNITIGNNEITFPDDIDDLIRMKIEVMNDIANITNQIAKAHLDNKLDDTWEFKARSSIEYKKVIIEAIDTMLRA